MDLITGKITIKKILSSNNNWTNFYSKNKDRIRDAIPFNINKLLKCKTPELGYSVYKCPKCGHKHTVNHTCKSRICSSCGKVATDNWVDEILSKFPDCNYQHLTFHPPSEFWLLFLLNRKIMLNILFKSVSLCLLIYAEKSKKCLPGLMLILHTFGRDLKFSPHIHVLITYNSLSLDNSKIVQCYIKEDIIKKMWRYHFTDLLRTSFKKNSLSFPISFNFSSLTLFNKFLNTVYNKIWYIFLNCTTKNLSLAVQYIGRYTKKPVLAEARIDGFDDNFVSFWFHDHTTGEKKSLHLSVPDFIARFIRHIPDKYFRNIRYAGFFSQRLSSTILPIVRKLLNQSQRLKKQARLNFKQRCIKEFKKNPLLCPVCKHIEMFLNYIIVPLKNGSFKTIFVNSP